MVLKLLSNSFLTGLIENAARSELEYWQAIQGIETEQLVFIDETGLWEGMERTRARSLKGQKAYGYRSQSKGKKQTLIGAITSKGVLRHASIPESMKGKDFLSFVQQQLSPRLEQGKVVVMDNLKAHKIEGVQQAIQQKGATVLYLPRYSPDFNPIEMYWSTLKAFVRQMKPKTAVAIEGLLRIGCYLFGQSYFTNWFTKCCYCTP
jgi:transposase